jgi:hypothetical protein
VCATCDLLHVVGVLLLPSPRIRLLRIAPTAIRPRRLRDLAGSAPRRPPASRPASASSGRGRIRRLSLLDPPASPPICGLLTRIRPPPPSICPGERRSALPPPSSLDYTPGLRPSVGITTGGRTPLLLLLGPSRSAHIAAAAQHNDSGPRRHLIRPTCPASTLIHLCLHNGYSFGRRHRHRCFSRHRGRSGRLGYSPLHPSGRRRRLP